MVWLGKEFARLGGAMIDTTENKKFDLQEALRKWLPERQIILRTEGETRYVRVTTRFQVGFLAIWVLFAGWVGFSTISYVNHLSVIAAKNDAIDDSRHAYRKLLDQVSDYQVSIVAITRDLGETETRLRELFHRNEELRQNLSSTEVALRSTKEERDRVRQGRKALGDQLEMLGSELRQITGKNNALENHIGSLRSTLQSVEAQKAEIAAERAALDDKLWQLHNELEAANNKTHLLETVIRGLKSDLRTVVLDRSKTASENDRLRAEVGGLSAQIESMREAHETELQVIADRTLSNIRHAEEVIRRTGLKLEHVAPLPSAHLTGQGGPFIPYHPDMDAPDAEESLRAKMDLWLDRWDQLSAIYFSLPLAKPIGNGYMTSGYGRRRDPFNGRLAMHYGVDFAGPAKQDVFTTADGVVTFSGHKSRYGRVVDVDHGNGLSTRYGHLHKTMVKVGQKVVTGDVIGLLGSTGRSTGPHVHYEVRYKGKALNPRKFLRAGNYVQKQVAKQR